MNFADVTKFKDVVKAEDGKAEKKVLVNTDTFRLIAIAIGKNGVLPEHPAPGNAMITVLKGEAVITYDSKDYKLEEGDLFYMEKGVLHSVKTDKKLEMTVAISL